MVFHAIWRTTTSGTVQMVHMPLNVRITTARADTPRCTTHPSVLVSTSVGWPRYAKSIFQVSVAATAKARCHLVTGESLHGAVPSLRRNTDKYRLETKGHEEMEEEKKRRKSQSVRRFTLRASKTKNHTKKEETRNSYSTAI